MTKQEQKEIDKQLDAIIKNRKIFKKLYKKETGLLSKLAVEVCVENIMAAQYKLEKLSK